MPNKSSSQKKLVILTACGPEHIYITNTLTQNFDIAAILVHSKQHKPSVMRVLKKGLFKLIRKATRLIFLKLISANKKNRQALINVLFRGKEPAFDRADLVIHLDSINSEISANKLDQLEPDALLVYGTPIVKDHILIKAKDIAFNLHTGISPYYRGTSCTLWPILEKQPEMLGSTLHECTSAVDGGRIFATKQSNIQEDDGLYEAFGRAVEVGAELYTEVVQQYLNNNLTGEPQDHALGREYLGAELTLIVQLRVRWSIMTGTLRRYARLRNELS